jgi:hypothetical protein
MQTGTFDTARQIASGHLDLIKFCLEQLNNANYLAPTDFAKFLFIIFYFYWTNSPFIRTIITLGWNIYMCNE